jgi:hypothetical protein
MRVFLYLVLFSLLISLSKCSRVSPRLSRHETDKLMSGLSSIDESTILSMVQQGRSIEDIMKSINTDKTQSEVEKIATILEGRYKEGLGSVNEIKSVKNRVKGKDKDKVKRIKDMKKQSSKGNSTRTRGGKKGKGGGGEDVPDYKRERKSREEEREKEKERRKKRSRNVA